MKRLLCVFATVLAVARAGAEPFLNRNVAALDAGRTAVALGGSWGASRGAFDDQQHFVGFSQTPGVALTRAATLEVRQGVYRGTEVRLAAGWAAQEIKVDRGIGASGYLGADTARGEGPTDVVISGAWTPTLTGDTHVGMEAGCKIPVTRGPEKASDIYDRLGTGGVSFPIGARATHRQGAITGYLSGFAELAVSRVVASWYGARPGGRFTPGSGFWFSGGAEVATSTGAAWSMEIAKAFTARERGEPAMAAGLLPATSSLTFVPSVSVPFGPEADLHLAAELPLAGRNTYQMFSGAAALRVRL